MEEMEKGECIRGQEEGGGVERVGVGPEAKERWEEG